MAEQPAEPIEVMISHIHKPLFGEPSVKLNIYWPDGATLQTIDQIGDKVILHEAAEDSRRAADKYFLERREYHRRKND